MTTTAQLAGLALAATATLAAGLASAQPLTSDQAVALALKNNTSVINAQAGVLDARGGLYSAYSGVLPHLSASYSRSGSQTVNEFGSTAFLGSVVPLTPNDSESYSTTPSLSGTWSVLDLSSIIGLSSARNGLKASRLRLQASRQDIAFSTRRQFYEVVRAIKLADVAEGALQLSRDDERRVRALFEVGSVSKSDLLRAQVRTSQSQLDSLTARQNVTVQRINLAIVIGIPSAELGEVDTVLTPSVRDFDEAALLAEAARSRPDLKAADAELAAARSGVTSARLARLPYVTVSGSATFNPKSTFASTEFLTDSLGSPFEANSAGTRESDRELSGRVALNWDLFDGFATDSRNASARARLVRAQETRDASHRNLASDVQQALIAYREAVERQIVASRSLESATENLKLTQQKYNVGSATILELIDAQVQLQRAQSDGVSALAAIRVAEAQLDRVRGRSE